MTGKLIEDTYRDEYDTSKYIRVYENMIVAKGGDGTLIKAVHMYRHLNKPFYGLAGGTIGFMMNKVVPTASYNPVRVRLNLLNVNVEYNNKNPEIYQAFNEICVGGDPKLWINFDIQEKDDLIGKFNGSGVIISTPQGSTGINKNNRGSILPLKSSLWSITGDKTSRNINYVIKPRKMKINFTSRQNVPVLVDGTYKILSNVKSVQVSKGEHIEILFDQFQEFNQKRKI